MPITRVQTLVALEIVMHLTALSDDELMALQEAITAERKFRRTQKRKPTLIWDLHDKG